MSPRAQFGEDALRLVAVIVVALVVFVAGVITFQRIGASRVTSVSLSAPCLLEVPVSAVFGSYGNSTSEGTTVTYLNGTEAFFPYYSCPVPVTPDNYRIDSVVEANPKFVAAENGSLYEATNSCNCTETANIVADNGSRWVSLDFDRYSSQRIYPCGADSYWVYDRTGLILVTIPVNSTGGLEFSQMVVQGGPGNYNQYSCTTTVVSSGQTP